MTAKRETRAALLAGDPAAELARLASLLDIGAGHFSLSIAFCNSSTWRDQLIAQLREQHDGIVTVDLPEMVGDVYRFVRERQPDPPGAALFITGLERSARARTDYQPELRATNAARELWEERYTCPVVFWLPEDVADLLPRHAPDLHRYISHHFYFLPPPPSAADLDRLPVMELADPSRQWLTSLAEDDERAAELSQRLEEVGAAPPPALVVQTSVWMRELAEIRMRQGRDGEALELAEQAVALLRPLAEARPDVFEKDLADALNGLGIRLSGLGRREDALAVAEEAVARSRVLAGQQPDAYASALAGHLNNLANRLSDVGRRKEALVVAEEAIEGYRSNAKHQRDAVCPELAIGLHLLATKLGALGRHQEALAAAEESLAIRRAVAATQPQGLDAGLATGLSTVAILLNDMGRYKEALAAAQEDVALRRSLAERQPDAVGAGIAIGLDNLARSLSGLGRHEDALAAATEAVAMRRTQAGQRPEVHGPSLARSLWLCAQVLSALGRHAEAVEHLAQAAQTIRQPYERYGMAHLDLVSAITNDYLTACHAADLPSDPEIRAFAEELGLDTTTRGTESTEAGSQAE